MMTKTNNLGAISALKGYRAQFLYSLLRILSYEDSEAEFHPEGEFEDLDIYNHEGTVIEIIQIKDLENILTLSEIITSRKENTFLKRAIKAYKGNHTPKIKLVSFGKINEDVKNLANQEYSKNLINKLIKQGLTYSDIKLLKGNFEYEIVNEQKIKENIILNIEKWGTFADTKITLDLLTYWIYYAAEKQIAITPVSFKDQFVQICRFQNERISFNKTYNSLIQPLDCNIEEENIESLKLDFYRGISASFKHILADVDVIRIKKLNLIKNKFNYSNIVFVHGASGQGKSTLAYRYIKENCVGATTFELKHLPDDITIIYNVINSLEGISKGIRFPITIYIDVEPGNKEWTNVLRDLASKKNFNFLITIREEDWNSIEVDDKFIFSEVEILFEQEEAELIYEALDEYNKDLKFKDFDNAWDSFGEYGPLMEFVYLITQNESLSAKLKYQINKIRSDSSVSGNEKIKILRYIVLADCYGSKIKLKEFNQFLQLKNEILFLVDLLQKEYLIKISGDKTHIVGLHPVRSKIIKELLFDGEIYLESDYIIDALSFISENTILNFLRNAFRYSELLPNKLIEKLNTFEPQKWQMYYQIFKSLLWKGIADYTNQNISILKEVYADYNKGWMNVVNFDFTNTIKGGSIMETTDFFTKEQQQYAKSINEKVSGKNEVFSYCSNWLSSINQINIIPEGKDEWDAFGLFLFWLHYFNNTTVVINYNDFQIEKNLSIQPLDVIAHVLYALKKYNTQSFLLVEKVEKLFFQKLSEKYNIITIEQENSTINCYYLFDIIDEKIESDESDFIHAKSIKIIDLLRFAFPDKELYGTKGVGHQFSFLPANYDSSIKQISQNNLPLKPLVEINSTYINLFEYTVRPKSWQGYVDEVTNRRLLIIEILSKMVKALNLYHKQKGFKPLVEYVQDYNENYHNLIKNKSIPTLPQLIIDEWGIYGEGNAKKIKSNFDVSDTIDNKEIKQMLAIRKYDTYRGHYRDFDVSIENFLRQSAESIIRKIKISLNEDISKMADNARISLVANLFRAFELVGKFQESFRNHFEKFVDPYVLKSIEKEEMDNISILCFLYRQYIYSDTFLNENASIIAINRIKKTELDIKKKVKNSFKQVSKELNSQIKVDFEENMNRCIISINLITAINTFEFLELGYDKLYELLEQPDYTSIKYLVLNTKYPVFNFLLLVSGKTINSMWYEFKTYNLREKRLKELEQFNLIPHAIPQDIIEKYKIGSWNKSIKEFQNLDRLLESTSMVFHLAYHFIQLKYFEDKTVEGFNENILNNHINKIGNLFQENLQKAMDTFGNYVEMCNNGEIEFYDNEEKIRFFELLVDNHKYFYPNDEQYEKGNLNLSLGVNEFETWLPELEKLVNNISIIYYFLAGKLIEKEIFKKPKYLNKGFQ